MVQLITPVKSGCAVCMDACPAHITCPAHTQAPVRALCLEYVLHGSFMIAVPAGPHQESFNKRKRKLHNKKVRGRSKLNNST
jgi:Fe-S-cluster-containing dehydrogenase component